MREPNLKEKVAIVTGAGGGIGQSIALALAEKGVRVVLAARTASDLEKVKAEIVKADGTAIAIPVDVTQEDEAVSLVSQAVAAFGHDSGTGNLC